MITVLEHTRNPLQFMGKCAGECWGADTSSIEKNIKRGRECLEIPHGRVLEYPDITIKIEGYSARAIRELYTHVCGTTRLQSSTRYVNYSELEYFTPSKIAKNEEASNVYNDVIQTIQEGYMHLVKECKIPKEDAANLLPLGMTSTVVLKINARALIHLGNLRLCNRAYYEIKNMVKEIKKTVSQLDVEWEEITNYMQPKCISVGYCTETYCCGLQSKKENIVIVDVDEYEHKQNIEEEYYSILNQLAEDVEL